MKDPFRLEKKSNLVFWITKWCHGKYTEEQLQSMPIDKLSRIYNKLLAEKAPKIFYKER